MTALIEEATERGMRGRGAEGGQTHTWEERQAFELKGLDGTERDRTG